MPRLSAPSGISSSRTDVLRIDGASSRGSDFVAVEEPLEIRIGEQRISITMRTPGDDGELAAGFLFSEEIIQSADDIASIRHCGPSGPERLCNTIRVDLSPGVAVDFDRLKRNVFTTSACGVCGKSSIEALKISTRCVLPDVRITAEAVRSLSERMRDAQDTFDRTGGIHAAALFDARGELVELREDVGRHNAVDKVVGARLLARRLPASEAVLMVSGRASYELAQKAIVAGIPILAAVGAPSSLAISLARELGLTLIGFLRGARFNVYAGEQRITTA